MFGVFFSQLHKSHLSKIGKFHMKTEKRLYKRNKNAAKITSETNKEIDKREELNMHLLPNWKFFVINQRKQLKLLGREIKKKKM
jgi:hypothetical protein